MTNFMAAAEDVKPQADEKSTTRERERLNTFSFSRCRLKRSGIGQSALCRPRATGAPTHRHGNHGGDGDE